MLFCLVCTDISFVFYNVIVLNFCPPASCPREPLCTPGEQPFSSGSWGGEIKINTFPAVFFLLFGVNNSALSLTLILSYLVSQLLHRQYLPRMTNFTWEPWSTFCHHWLKPWRKKCWVFRSTVAVNEKILLGNCQHSHFPISSSRWLPAYTFSGMLNHREIWSSLHIKAKLLSVSTGVFAIAGRFNSERGVGPSFESEVKLNQKF